MTGVNEAQREAWNGESGLRWTADADGRDRVIAGVTAVLLEAAALQSGERVLDVGCGCGATTIAAAEIVGRDGPVVGVDVSEPMLAVARQRVADAALPNVSFHCTDAQTHSFEPRAHDVAISRFGTMFFDDPAAAFTNIARTLRPAGRLGMATWQPLVANQWLTVPGAELLRYGTLPETAGPGPGMFALSDPTMITDVLTEAGLTDVDVEAVTVALHLGADVEQAVEYLAGMGVGRAMLATIPERDHAEALDAVRAALVDHATDEGVHLDGAILVTTATNR